MYFLSNTDGTFCLYSQRLDPASKRPFGGAELERHFHDPRWSIPSISNLRYEFDGDRLIIPLTETTGNIWMLESLEEPK